MNPLLERLRAGYGLLHMARSCATQVRITKRKISLRALLAALAACAGCDTSYAVVALLDRVDLPTGLSPSALVVSDMNQDGRPDVLVINRGSHNLSLLWNQATGLDSTTRRVDYGVVPDGIPSGLAVGDLNGDGWPDVVVLIESQDVLNVRLNKGDGTLDDPLQIPTAALRPTAVVIVDADQDGLTDLVVNSEDLGGVYLLHNEGGGTKFGIIQLLAQYFDSAPTALAVTDANGDGRPELVVSRQTSGQVSVLYNMGNGVFQEHSYALGLNPSLLALGDVDRDGRLDILAGDSKLQKLALLLRLPDGTFQLNATYPVVGELSGLAVGDVYGDGSSDILATRRDTNQVDLLLNSHRHQGTDRFLSVAFDVGRQPSAAVLADLNGDGLADVVVANGGDGTISYLPNGSR